MWNLEAPSSFQGLREDLPLEMYLRHMPHWRQAGATYFVTFRLADSLPTAKLDELAALRHEWELRHAPPHSKEALDRLAHQQASRIEQWLDEGMGSCVLKEPISAGLLADGMHHFDCERYELGAYVIMPNHCHALVRPLDYEVHPLETILGSWKGISGKQINARRDRHGTLWQDESYDRIVRDAEHLYRCVQYIGRNPAKSRLRDHEFLLWLRPEWQQQGWRFESS